MNYEQTIAPYRNRVIQGNSLKKLKELPDGSVDTCVTSPPYFGLRDYGTATWEGGDQGCDHKTKIIPAIVLDPFDGAGTTRLVARKLGRDNIGIELNPDYIKIGDKRSANQLGMFL